MQRAGRLRAALYGAAVSAAGALLWLGFVHEPAPEFAQLLSQVNANLRLANSIPAVDKDGAPVAAHEQLLVAAERDIALARAQRTDSAVLAEFEGFACSLRGKDEQAAAHYRRARSLPDCEKSQRDVLTFNEARMLRRAGKPEAALAVLDDAQTSFEGAYAAQCRVERAELLGQLSRVETPDSASRRARSVALLDEVLGGEVPVAWAQAGQVYQSLGLENEAEAAWAKASATVPIADGFRARLKLKAGDVDTALQLFERAAKAAPAEMRRLVREDPAAWQAIAKDARFVQLVESKAAAPVR
ncbi:MAG: hypothetical protein RIT24_2395 [Planctomycetota bacterium]